MADETLEVDLIVEAIAKGFDDLNRDIKKTGTTAEKSSDGMTKGAQATNTLNRAFTSLVSAGVVTAAVAAIVEFGRESLRVAADVEETASLIDNSLGSASSGFVADIDAIATATNRSAIQLKEGSSTIIAMTRAMGAGQQEAATYSSTMAQIAVDLGSFFNRDEALVFEDIQGALAGSSETLQKYGIDVRETTLKNMALEQGLIGQGETLTQLQRAQLIQVQIQQQAADAMGDAERTAESYSNQVRALEAAELDLKAATGELIQESSLGFVQLRTTAVKNLNIIVSGINRVNQELSSLGASQLSSSEKAEKLSQALNDANNVTGRLFGQYGKIRDEITKLAAETGDWTGTNEELKQSLDEVFGAGTILDDAYIQLANGMSLSRSEAEQLNEELTKRIDADTSQITQKESAAIKENTRALAQNNRERQQSNRELSQNERLIQKARDRNRELVPTYQELDRAWEASRQQLEDFNAEQEESARVADIVVGAYGRSGSAISDLFQAYEDLAAAEGEWVQASRDNTDEIADIYAQLGADLTDETAKANKEVLTSSEATNAEIVAAYKLLEGDLTATQRAELLTRLNDLQTSHGEILNVYTGDAQAKEDSMERIKAANESIKQSRTDMIIDIVKNELQTTFEADAIAAEIAAVRILEARGQITEAEAQFRLDILETDKMAVEATRDLVAEFDTAEELMTDGIEKIVAGVGFIEEGIASTSENAVTFAQNLNNTVSPAIGTLERKAGEAKQNIIGLGQEVMALDGLSPTITLNIKTSGDFGAVSALGGIPQEAGSQDPIGAVPTPVSPSAPTTPAVGGGEPQFGVSGAFGQFGVGGININSVTIVTPDAQDFMAQLGELQQQALAAGRVPA